ncbi:antA/AntB antirepressor family protein [Thiorhodospira sibirica]|uniref:antA/AntB antirepressor family protein n=1 Tax=Thiorhodospira sibirica TaxID=154347 RepID=UPI00022C52A2|nr:antA/AntB antirepressor family protein [Thiorhodospira sibirica]
MTAHSLPLVHIAGTPVQPILYQAQPVLTLAMMDQIHQRPKGTARKRFNDNKGRLREGVDWFKVSASEIRTHSPDAIPKARKSDVILVNEFGYLLLVKSFTDDLAWEIQRQLVTVYFRLKDQVQPAPKPLPSTWVVLRQQRLGQCVQDTLDARTLHHVLGNKRHYSDWIKQRLSRYPFIEAQDFVSYSQPCDHPRGGRPLQEYQISIDMAKALCIIENTAASWVAYRDLCEHSGLTDDAATSSSSLTEQLNHLHQQLKRLNHRLSTPGLQLTSDPLHQRLAAWLAGRQHCTLAEISAALFDLPVENLSCLGKMRIHCLLQELGWHIGQDGSFQPLQ